jgi:hypothetical protein
MMDGSCGTHGTDEKYAVRDTKPEENRSLGRSKRRWEDNTNFVKRNVMGELGLDSSISG